MREEQLSAFLAVAAAGTVRGAALALGCQPPTVSRRLRSLERELGVALLARGPAGAARTEAGARFEGPARDLLDAMRQAREAPGQAGAPS